MRANNIMSRRTMKNLPGLYFFSPLIVSTFLPNKYPTPYGTGIREGKLTKNAAHSQRTKMTRSRR